MAGHRIPVKNYFKFNKKRKKIIKIHDILRVTHLLFNRLLINYLPKLLLFLTNI